MTGGQSLVESGLDDVGLLRRACRGLVGGDQLEGFGVWVASAAAEVLDDDSLRLRAVEHACCLREDDPLWIAVAPAERRDAVARRPGVVDPEGGADPISATLRWALRGCPADEEAGVPSPNEFVGVVAAVPLLAAVLVDERERTERSSAALWSAAEWARRQVDESEAPDLGLGLGLVGLLRWAGAPIEDGTWVRHVVDALDGDGRLPAGRIAANDDGHHGEWTSSSAVTTARGVLLLAGVVRDSQRSAVGVALDGRPRGSRSLAPGDVVRSIGGTRL